MTSQPMASQLVRLLDQHDLPAAHVPTDIFVVARLAMGGEVIAVHRAPAAVYSIDDYPYKADRGRGNGLNRRP
jgi:hypothetical protein